MIDQDATNEFETVFRLNIARRSRTAGGQDKGSETSSKKKPLLLSGEALAAKVAANTDDIITATKAWVMPVNGVPYSPSRYSLKRFCEMAFEMANNGLYGPTAYETEYAALQADAERLTRSTGERFPTNPRYRLWTPTYTTLQVPPILLERFMESFYQTLALRMSAETFRGNKNDIDGVSRLMAYADLMMDGELHPWMDGCGRVSTALIMLIALTRLAPGTQPPLFAETKQGHYATIRDLERHTAYYRDCLKRPLP